MGFVTKYSASGNDFVIFDALRAENRSDFARKICDRHEGVGADGLIVIVPYKEKGCDFAWQFYNSDGSEADMCGNGSRACAHYAFAHKIAPKKMKFLTKAGVISAEVDGDIVEVELTEPKKLGAPFEEAGFLWHRYNTGVPHLITLVDNLDKFDLELSRKMRQKYDSNVNFMMIDKAGTIFVRTYERGVENETLACGTGVAACFCAALDLGLGVDSMRVLPKSKEELFVSKKGGKIFFKGKVKPVFKAELGRELDEVFS